MFLFFHTYSYFWNPDEGRLSMPFLKKSLKNKKIILKSRIKKLYLGNSSHKAHYNPLDKTKCFLYLNTKVSLLVYFIYSCLAYPDLFLSGWRIRIYSCLAYPDLSEFELFCRIRIPNRTHFSLQKLT